MTNAVGNHNVPLSLPLSDLFGSKPRLVEAGFRLGGRRLENFYDQGGKVGHQEAKRRLVWALQPVTNHSR